MRFLRIIVYSIVFLKAGPAGAQLLRVAPIFTNHMVIQAHKPVYIWGRAQVRAAVSVSFSGKVKKVLADEEGYWGVTFPKMAPSFDKTYELSVSDGDRELLFSDILIGDVWLCIGQYNMSFPLQDDETYFTEKTHTNNPYLRLFYADYITRKLPLRAMYNDEIKQNLSLGYFYKGAWSVSQEKTAAKFSAIGYYFGKIIQSRLQIPVGMIDISVGGSSIESWIDAAALLKHKRLARKAKGNWLFNGDLPSWIKIIGAYNLSGFSEPPAGFSETEHPYKPGFIYKNLVETFESFPVKGVLMYQGESNAGNLRRVEEYPRLLDLLIKEYRSNRSESRLPFYFVQLASVVNEEGYKEAKYWPDFRNGQRLLAGRIPYVDLVPAYDFGGSDAVSSNKKVIAERLAALVLFGLYKKRGENVLPPPNALRARYLEGKGVLITFEHTGRGLSLSLGASLHGFTTGKEEEADADIYRNKWVLVRVKRKPKYVYYAWSPSAVSANLVNSAGMPALAFKLKVD